MKMGTKSLLFGSHQFLIHSLIVARAWWLLFGFPWDPRLWVCFFVHDLGYWGKPDMDGEEGKTHPELGAHIAHWLCDRKDYSDEPWEVSHPLIWHDFCLYHSRSYSKKNGRDLSRLALADKLAFAITPWWLFIPMCRLTGEIGEYIHIYEQPTDPRTNLRKWLKECQAEVRAWVYDTLKRPSPMPEYYRT